MMIASISFSSTTASSVQQNPSVQFLPDADLPAKLWADEHPDSLAVAVRLGPETTVPPQRIETALRADFSTRGLSKVRFFWERGSTGGSSVIYITRNHAWGPFGLADSRSEAANAAAQLLFEVERGLH